MILDCNGLARATPTVSGDHIDTVLAIKPRLWEVGKVSQSFTRRIFGIHVHGMFSSRSSRFHQKKKSFLLINYTPIDPLPHKHKKKGLEDSVSGQPYPRLRIRQGLRGELRLGT